MKKDQSIQKTKRVPACKEEGYMAKIFSLLRAKNRIVFHDEKTHFNDTEIRLMSEIVSASYEGKRLISTQLADLLGVTRSAISQIVNRLEGQGVVKRVADEVDKKIAYIEITKEIWDTYNQDLEMIFRFLHEVVGKFGEERFYRMCEDFESFIELAKNAAETMQKNSAKK